MFFMMIAFFFNVFTSDLRSSGGTDFGMPDFAARSSGFLSEKQCREGK